MLYIPASFREPDTAAMHDFIAAHPFGAVVSVSDARVPQASHVPMVLDRTRGAHGTLTGHLARANPHTATLADGDRVLVLFTGADAYVTPAWYPAKQEHGKVVPTWNYVAVHASGTIRVRADAEFLREHVASMTTEHERAQAHPWSIDDAPAEYMDAQMRAIVGFEVDIDLLEGKWKMSQNRSAADIAGVTHGMQHAADPRTRETGALVAARNPHVAQRNEKGIFGLP